MTHIVTISWPADPERGSETYGLFAGEKEALAWAVRCQDAADLGWRLLQGAQYVVQQLSEPFDPDSLMQDGATYTA